MRRVTQTGPHCPLHPLGIPHPPQNKPAHCPWQGPRPANGGEPEGERSPPQPHLARPGYLGCEGVACGNRRVLLAGGRCAVRALKEGTVWAVTIGQKQELIPGCDGKYRPQMSAFKTNQLATATHIVSHSPFRHRVSGWAGQLRRYFTHPTLDSWRLILLSARCQLVKRVRLITECRIELPPLRFSFSSLTMPETGDTHES